MHFYIILLCPSLTAEPVRRFCRSISTSPLFSIMRWCESTGRYRLLWRPSILRASMRASSTRTGRLHKNLTSDENSAIKLQSKWHCAFVFGGLSGRFLLVQSLIAAFWRTPSDWIPERLNWTTSRLRQYSTSENKQRNLIQMTKLQFPFFNVWSTSSLFSLFFLRPISLTVLHQLLPLLTLFPLAFFSQTDCSGGGAARSGSNSGLPADLGGAAGAGAGGRAGRCEEGPEVSRPQTGISDALMLYSKVKEEVSQFKHKVLSRCGVKLLQFSSAVSPSYQESSMCSWLGSS